MNDLNNNKSFSPEEVQGILSSLSNEKTKKAFLEKIYIPGNKEIAELLMPYDRSVVEKEILFALQTNDQERAVEMAKKEIDYYLENNFHILLRDKLKVWGNPDIIQYVLSKIETGDASLENAFYLLEQFGTPEQIKKNREALLALEIDDHKYPSAASHILVGLGRYDEAIDRNIKYFNKDRYYLITNARKIAKEHAPHRQKEIAEIVFKEGLKKNSAEEYYECGIYLGKESEVRSAVKNTIKEILYKKTGIFSKEKKDISDEPRFFYDIVKVMRKLGGFEKELTDITQQIEAFVNTEKDYVSDIYKEMAEFYHILENKEKSLEWFAKVLDYEIAQCHPSHASNTIKHVEELYGEGIMEEKNILIYERNGLFLEAANLAEKLGFKDKAEAYKKTAEVLGDTQKEK